MACHNRSMNPRMCQRETGCAGREAGCGGCRIKVVRRTQDMRGFVQPSD